MKRSGNKQITIPRGRKKKSPKPHFHSPLFILAHLGKSLKNLLLIIGTLGCRHFSALLAKQSCAAARGLKSQISCPILQLRVSNMEDLIIAAQAPVEHKEVYPGKNMCSLLDQICTGRASELAVQWARLSRPAVPQRPRFSLCVSSSPASRPCKVFFAQTQTP